MPDGKKNEKSSAQNTHTHSLSPPPLSQPKKNTIDDEVKNKLNYVDVVRFLTPPEDSINFFLFKFCFCFLAGKIKNHTSMHHFMYNYLKIKKKI